MTASGNLGVFVVGMHRGGTSAVTRLVNLLGVPTGAADAMKKASVHNPTGFWEVAALTRLDDQLLGALGGSWAAPRMPATSWARDEHLEPLRDPARELFLESHPTPQWVWKDPRNSILLPFWLDLLEVEPVVVLVRRHPLEIAESLAVRDGLSRQHALALWERYMRQALAAADGLPLLAASYSEVLGDPAAWMATAHDFLAAQGAELTPAPAAGEEAAQFIDPGLRHTEFAAEEIGLSEPQRELLAALDALGPTHARFEAPRLPGETPSTEALLAERRFTERTHAEQTRLLREARRTRRKTLARVRRQLARVEAELAGADATQVPAKRLLRDLGRVGEQLAELQAADDERRSRRPAQEPEPG